MTTMEACHLVLKTISLNLRNKIFVLNMGKPINIFKIAKKISSFKKKIDPFYEFKYIETGLGQNEKLHEVLFEKKEKYKIINKDIFYIDRKNIDLDKFISCFEKLKYYFNISDEIKLKNTLNKMIKI